MIKLENHEVLGFEHAIRGMRNPMNSWEKSDSWYCQAEYGVCHHSDNHTEPCHECGDKIIGYCIGENDYDLMKRLVKAGTDHSKFMRMITVYVDITAPLYFWKEADTYKVGTVANSCSTMHKIHAKEFTLDDFSCEHLCGVSLELMNIIINKLNFFRDLYINFDKSIVIGANDKKDVWWQMIQLLPSSYNQKRTVQLNYAVLRNMYHSRKNHKLDEWHTFCDWIKTLPYSELITM